MRTAIVGGGAAGFFLAINLKEMLPAMDVTILERSQRVLAKVEVSGGGRCNCTNTFADITDLAQVYPRGHRLLKRLFKGFDHRDAYQWFERHGVRLTTQADNCVFPASQDSHTIINSFLYEARRHDIKICTGVRVQRLDTLLADYDFVAVCTGGSPRLEGLQWLADAGHEIAAPVPSLFTLSIDEAYGPYVEEAVQRVPRSVFEIEGRLDRRYIYEGAIVPLMNGDGERFNGTITEIGEKEITVDLNHPFAGKPLHFVGSVTENRLATTEEMQKIVAFADTAKAHTTNKTDSLVTSSLTLIE